MEIRNIDLMEIQEELYRSNYKSIKLFMIQTRGIDYDLDKVWVEVEKQLTATMERHESKVNGYTVYQWLDK